jgi:hypothetical protein
MNMKIHNKLFFKKKKQIQLISKRYNIIIFERKIVLWCF